MRAEKAPVCFHQHFGVRRSQLHSTAIENLTRAALAACLQKAEACKEGIELQLAETNHTNTSAGKVEGSTSGFCGCETERPSLPLDTPPVKCGGFDLQLEDEGGPPAPGGPGPQRKQGTYLGSRGSSAVAIRMTWQFKLGHARAFLRRNGMLFLQRVVQPL